MYYDHFETGVIGCLTLVADEAGLRRIDFQTDAKNAPRRENGKKNPAFFAEAKAQLRAYFKRERKRFDLPLAPEGTEFQLRVWRALQAIPYGDLASYQAIAAAAGNPRAARAAGAACGKNPIPIIIPCHRVVGSDGSLTGFGGGLAVKQRLIDLERTRV
ncbi:MAG: methylated-DNA--[protein]-cysteine S-methyltransferase [Thermodesulfobacteriota bacterium]